MITLRRRRGLLGEQGVSVLQVEARPGLTYRDLVHAHAIPEWRGLRVSVARAGELLRAEQLDDLARDDDDLVLAADPEGIELAGLLLYTLVSAAVGVVLNLAMRALLPTPKAPGESQPIGDESSPSSSWDGIRTTRGQGLPTATVLGRRGVGGHIIFSEVVADSIASPGREITRLVLALSRGGRIDKIGGISGGTHGEIDGLGGFAGGASGGAIPAGMRINGNLVDHTDPLPGLRAWLRFGELDQSPLPAPFVGAKITDLVNGEFRDAGDATRYTVDDESSITAVTLVLVAPGGIYTQDPATGQRGIAPVLFEPRWRRQGSTAWQQFWDSRQTPITTREYAGSAFSGQSYGETWQLFLPQAEDGPLEIQLRRLTPTHGSNAVDVVNWRQVTWSSPHVFSYPGVALLALEIESGELWSGGTPSFVVPVDGLQVRTYDPSNGLATTRTWEVAASGAHSYWQHPPGRNPAWIFLEVATGRWALGRYGFSTSKVDLPALAAWACYCDALPGPAGQPWTEARYCADLVTDSPRAAWDWLQAIAAAGGGVAYMAGDRLTVAYRYRDAHAIGPIAVPAKAASQLLASPILQSVSARWIDARERPAVIDYQIFDEGKAWAPTAFAVRDPDTSADSVTALRRDNATVEPLEMWAVTRPSQCFRMGWLAHRLNRMAIQELVGEVSYACLAATIGDVVNAQSVVLRPFGDDSVPFAATIASVDVTGAQITIDRAITLAAGIVYVLQVRNAAGDFDEAEIVSAPGDYSAGDPIDLGAAVDCYVGAALVIGREDEVIVPFEILAIGLDPDGTRQLTTRLWTPQAYDEPSPDDFAGATSSPAVAGDILGAGDIGQGEIDVVTPVQAADLRVDVLPDRRGAWRVSFPLVAGVQLVRVYVRPVGAQAWWLLAESADPAANLIGYRPGDTLEVMVSTTHRGGSWSRPGAGGIAQLVLPEFPAEAPPAVQGADLQAGAGGTIVRWRGIDDEGSRIVVRRGEQPELADELFEGRADHLLDPSPVYVRTSLGYWLATRDRVGMLGPWTNAQDPDALAIAALPASALTAALISGDVIGLHTATLAGLVNDSELDGLTGARIDDGLHAGTATSPELVLRNGSSVEYETEAYWSAGLGVAGRDHATVDDVAEVEIGSGEALWRSIDWREASLALPGISPDTVDDLSGLSLDQADAAGIGAFGLTRGEPGRHAWGELWSRFRSGGSWSAWARHVDGRRSASRMQLQARLWRDDLRAHVYATRLIGFAFV